MLLSKGENMQYFDLHCDTLYKATVVNSSFNDSKNHVSIDKAKVFDNWTQMFAIWIPDDVKGDAATSLFTKAASLFAQERVNNEKIKMHLAVENASMLGGNIDNISLLVKNDVKYVTLTWNGVNELGCGALCSSGTGLTKFGKEVVRELNFHNISVDVSHACDKLFYDVVSVTKKPIIATHSNSRAITDVKRNLTDEQFKIIRDMGGVVGLNFYNGFLSDGNACIDDIIRHAEHFLNLDGEKTLAVGADFDGADMPSDIQGIETIPAIYQRFVEEFGAKLTKKVFYDNANMYFTNFDNKM